MAPKPTNHVWQPEERDALELEFKEYGLGNGREVDAHRIFDHIFGWSPSVKHLCDQWRSRFQSKRSSDWPNIHSKDLLSDYSAVEQARRAAVRVRVLAAAQTLGVHLAPLAAYVGLHTAGLATFAGTGPAPAAAQSFPAASTVLATTVAGPAHALSHFSMASAASSSSSIASSTASASASTGTEIGGPALYHSLLPTSFLQAPGRKTFKRPAADYLDDDGEAKKIGSARGKARSTVAKRSRDSAPFPRLQPTNREHHQYLVTFDLVEMPSRRADSIRATHGHGQAPGDIGEFDDKSNAWKTINPNSIVPLRRAHQKQPQKMNMVHSNSLHLVPVRHGGRRVECSIQFELTAIKYEHAVYKYGGVASEVWFFNWKDGQKGWSCETCMVCDTDVCTLCNPEALPPSHELTQPSPTDGLPFVHGGRDCQKNYDGELVWVPQGDKKKPNESEMVHEKRIFYDFKQGGDVEKGMSDLFEERYVCFWGGKMELAMVCVSGECDICGDWEIAEDGQKI